MALPRFKKFSCEMVGHLSSSLIEEIISSPEQDSYMMDNKNLQIQTKKRLLPAMVSNTFAFDNEARYIPPLTRRPFFMSNSVAN